jgi:DNA-directed RNA polymerase specialized sigma24 family protein
LTIDMPLSQRADFPTTHWTLVQAVQGEDADAAGRAMDALCKGYWYPIYAYLRRSGHTIQEAEDLTQAFFHRLITEDALLMAQQGSGKLRSWLLGVLKHLLSDHFRHANTQKRGGGVPHVSFDEMGAEERYAHEPQSQGDPDAFFTQVWAQDLLASVRAKLRVAYEAAGRKEVFDLLLPYLLWDREPPSCRQIAEKIGSSEVGTRILIHRLRVKFRTLLKEEVARTVLTPEEIPAELAWLQGVLAGR